METIRNRIENLLMRREISIKESDLLLELLRRGTFFQKLMAPGEGKRYVMIFLNQTSLTIVRNAMRGSQHCMIISDVPASFSMSKAIDVMTHDAAEAMCVLLRRVLDGSGVPAPTVLAIDIGVRAGSSEMPGTMTWQYLGETLFRIDPCELSVVVSCTPASVKGSPIDFGYSEEHVRKLHVTESLSEVLSEIRASLIGDTKHVEIIQRMIRTCLESLGISYLLGPPSPPKVLSVPSIPSSSASSG